MTNEIKLGRLSHAYLFTGSRGTGKTTCAKILAKAVNCLQPVDGDPCGECEICRGIENGTILDIVEIDAASNRKIDDIRQLRDEVSYAPATARYRVYIIDEVHMLTMEAFNALLKTLEEPPAHVIFILATTEVHKLPSTILSRCQRFDFRRISADVIAQRITEIAAAEGHALEADAALLIARIADGAMRDALSLLDRCIGSGENITSSDVTACAGLMDRSYLFELSGAVQREDTEYALKVLDSLHAASCDSERICTELLEHFRNILIIKTVENSQEIVVCTTAQRELFRAQAESFSTERILFVIDTLGSVADRLKNSRNGRVEAEMTVVRLCNTKTSTDTAALLARIGELERKLDGVLSGGVLPVRQSAASSAPSLKAAAPAMAQLPGNGNSGVKTEEPFASVPSPAVQEQEPSFDNNDAALPFDDEPLPENTFFPPVPTDEDDEPLPENTFFPPVPMDEDDEPLPENTFFPPVPTDEDDEPLPENTFFPPVPSDEDDEPLPENTFFPPVPSDEDDEPLPFDDMAEYVPPTQSVSAQAFPSQSRTPVPSNNSAPVRVQTPSPSDNPSPVRVQTPDAGTNRVSLNSGSFPQWPKVVATAKSICPPLTGMIDGATAVLNGDVIVISTPNPLLKQLMSNHHYSDAVSAASERVTGIKYKVKIV